MAKKNKVGRPKKVTQEIVNKLEHAFAIGCTDKEACLYADISQQTLYTYQNETPGFLERKELLKETPVLKARSVVIKELEAKDPNMARWYLERKRKSEFSTREERTGGDGMPLPANQTTVNVNGGGMDRATAYRALLDCDFIDAEYTVQEEA